jgi:ATP-binding cassette subfamily B (MDR/TAP) protein 1
MARFIAGFAVGFSSVWQLTLVTLAVVPVIALAGGAYAVVMIGITSKSQKAYSKAGEIAEEVSWWPVVTCSKIIVSVACLFTLCWRV